MSPKKNIKEERKKQILNAAMTVFSQKGFHQARMDDIVEESGLSKGTIYWYFKSKDEIIWTIMGTFFESEFEILGEMLDEEIPAGEKISKFTQIALVDVENLMVQIPLTYEFISAASRESGIRELLKKYLRRYLELLNPIIQQGVDSGEFRSMDAQDASIAIGAVIEGIILLWVYDPEVVDLKRHMNSSIESLLNGFYSR